MERIGRASLQETEAQFRAAWECQRTNMNHVLRAITDNGTGLKHRYLMARASYYYSRSYGLTVLYSLRGALELFFQKDLA